MSEIKITVPEGASIQIDGRDYTPAAGPIPAPTPSEPSGAIDYREETDVFNGKVFNAINQRQYFQVARPFTVNGSYLVIGFDIDGIKPGDFYRILFTERADAPYNTDISWSFSPVPGGSTLDVVKTAISTRAVRAILNESHNGSKLYAHVRVSDELQDNFSVVPWAAVVPVDANNKPLDR